MNPERLKKIDDDTYNKDNTKLDISDFKPTLKIVREDEVNKDDTSEGLAGVSTKEATGVKEELLEDKERETNTAEKVKEIKEKMFFNTKENIKDISYKELDYKSLTKKQKGSVFNSPINKNKDKKEGIFSKIKSSYEKIENYVKNKRDKNYYEKGEKYLNERNDGEKMKQNIEELMKTDPLKAKKWIIALGKGWKSFEYNPDTKEFKNTTKYSKFR